MKRNSTCSGRTVIVLGDQYTGEKVETMLAERAAECRVTIAGAYIFDVCAPGRYDDLSELEPVVNALNAAIRGGYDIWVPFTGDLVREEHIRRMGLVLERHGLALRMGRNLWAPERGDGINEIDAALRHEVHAVDDLHQSVLAAAAMTTLSNEIAMELWRDDVASRQAAKAAPSVPSADETLASFLDELAADHGPCPPLPSATAAWSRRRPALRRFAGWLVHHCGFTRIQAAELLNRSGHRTQHGREWRPRTVSALVNGREDRRSVA